MAGLVPAIHVLAIEKKGVDARVKPGHDGRMAAVDRKNHVGSAAGDDHSASQMRVKARRT
jgi:hypothetical protein